jgi:opacity protein-like surface antigen
MGGLELEPEIQVYIPLETGADVAYFAQGHVLYNFSLAGKIVPFIGGGAGIGNGLPVYGLIEGGADTRSFAWIGMAGAKFMVTKAVAIRMEYRFNRVSWEIVNLVPKEWGNIHQVLTGISVFF